MATYADKPLTLENVESVQALLLEEIAWACREGILVAHEAERLRTRLLAQVREMEMDSMVPRVSAEEPVELSASEKRRQLDKELKAKLKRQYPVPLSRREQELAQQKSVRREK